MGEGWERVFAPHPPIVMSSAATAAGTVRVIRAGGFAQFPRFATADTINVRAIYADNLKPVLWRYRGGATARCAGSGGLFRRVCGPRPPQATARPGPVRPGDQCP